MPDARDLFDIYVGGLLAIGVIVLALGASLFIYQRRFFSLHREYARKLIAAHEEERAYVAREVHDDALQRVALIQHDVADWLDKRPSVSAQDRASAEGFRQELEDLGVMLRRVAHRLHPAIIDQGGLLPALSQLADDMSRITAVEVSARLPVSLPVGALDRERSLLLFRIAQEALRNVARHSGARTAEVAVEVQDDRLILVVKDDGRGFDAADSRHAAGLGLVSMGERARLAEGSYTLWSVPGGGTTIRVSVPLRVPPP